MSYISLTSKAEYHNLEILETDFVRDSGTYTIKASSFNCFFSSTLLGLDFKSISSSSPALSTLESLFSSSPALSILESLFSSTPFRSVFDFRSASSLDAVFSDFLEDSKFYK
jgi:hypothetical protein